MNQYLKTYLVTLTVQGPVFVGNGKEINKKEYIFFGKNQVGIIDIPKFYSFLKSKRLEREFEKYLLHNQKDTLNQWLLKNRIQTETIRPYIRYCLDSGDVNVDRTKKLQIMECVKDSYQLPYIPGSSMKGMIRTVMLGADILRRQEAYRGLRQKVSYGLDNIQRNPAQYLKREAEQIEAFRFRTLSRNEKKSDDPVNDVLAGMIVSDSEPFRLNDLILCQKIERHTDGREKPLNLLRECVRPGTKIVFQLTLDTSLCKFSIRDLMDAVRIFGISYYENFVHAFRMLSSDKGNSYFDRPKENTVYLGGGCGFVSKTVTYPLFGKEEGIRAVQKIFLGTKVPRNHKHDRDIKLGVSPHIIKCTYYKGQTLQMGLCLMECQPM